MSNETVTPKFNILRNGVTKPLEEQVFGKKSDNAGKKFYAPVFAKDTLSNDLVWLGYDQAIGVINKNLRLVSADIFLQNIERNNGVLDEEEFVQEMQDLTASRVSLADIESELEDLYALQTSYIEDDNFGATVSDTSDEKTEEAKVLEAKLSDCNKKIKPLKLKKQEIEKEYAMRAEKRKATKAAKAATAGTAPAAQTAAVAA